jgi:DNA-binding FadR family transcriptional regulator
MENKTLRLKAVGRQENLYEAVAAQIREAVLNGSLKPGQTLPNETELARQMGVSRPVIREALRFLQAQGLVRINRGTKGGAVVGDIDHLFLLENIADLIRLRRLTVDHLIQVRQFVEPEVFRLAARNASDEDLAALERLVERTEQEEDLDLKRELNAEFHRQVGRACGNPIYAALVNRVLDFTLAFVNTLKPRHLILHKDEEHRLILRALQKRQARRAALLLLEHVRTLNQQMKELEAIWLQMQSGV